MKLAIQYIKVWTIPPRICRCQLLPIAKMEQMSLNNWQNKQYLSVYVSYDWAKVNIIKMIQGFLTSMWPVRLIWTNYRRKQDRITKDGPKVEDYISEPIKAEYEEGKTSMANDTILINFQQLIFHFRHLEYTLILTVIEWVSRYC